MNVRGPVRAIDSLSQNLNRMELSLVEVPKSSVPRRRTLIKLIDMGNRMAKMNNSDRSIREEACVFCGIIRGEGSRKIYEVLPRHPLVSSPLFLGGFQASERAGHWLPEGMLDR